ncbi:flagellar hook protein FlgE [Tabrizicola sp. M-4]|uniref:flagellar hook protein FlgE n=1 Tax=Tabrizicola sp. M-4 TaxID=3055847 RepID=UPI003DA7B49F
MSISSSLNAGVAGLNANATRLATISDNIANSSTFGYRRAFADFEALTIGGSQGGGGFIAGGVMSATTRLIDEEGSLVATRNALDIAVSGRGMLPVRSIAGLNSPEVDATMTLMRTGAFRLDANGFLTTESGLVLLGWPANADGSMPIYARDSESGLSPIRVDRNQRVGDPTTSMTLGVNLPASGTMVGASGQSLPLNVEYFGNLGTSETLAVTFIPTVPASGVASNTWRMEVRDSAQAGALVGEFSIIFDDSRSAGGSVLSVTPGSAGTYDAASGKVTINVAGGPIEILVGAPGIVDGLVQLDDTFSPVGIAKDGSPIGTMTGLEVDEEGFLIASFDTGYARKLYQIPLVDVPNLNGLRPLPDMTYQITPQSGAFLLWTAGTGPTGRIAGFAREGSTTDVAAELTAMIQTQRAYASNAKVIQTVDEMLQETTNIKR